MIRRSFLKRLALSMVVVPALRWLPAPRFEDETLWDLIQRRRTQLWVDIYEKMEDAFWGPPHVLDELADKIEISYTRRADQRAVHGSLVSV